MRFVLAMLSCAFVLLAAPVFAATIELGSALGSMEPYVNTAVSIGVTVLVGFLLFILKSKFNIEIDAGHRDTLMTFAQNQAAALVAKGAVKVKGAKIEVDNETLANVANAALSKAPDALAHFGLTPEKMQERIVAELSKQPAVAAALAEATKA